MQNLIERFDSNCDGGIDYEEFVREISPKTEKKYRFLDS